MELRICERLHHDHRVRNEVGPSMTFRSLLVYLERRERGNKSIIRYKFYYAAHVCFLAIKALLRTRYPPQTQTEYRLTKCRVSPRRQNLVAQNPKGVKVQRQLLDANVQIVPRIDVQRSDVGAFEAHDAFARSEVRFGAILATRVTAIEEKRESAIFGRSAFNRRRLEFKGFLASAADRRMRRASTEGLTRRLTLLIIYIKYIGVY